MIKVIEVKVAIDIKKHECWAGIETSIATQSEEENAIIRIILDGMLKDKWTKMPFTFTGFEIIKKTQEV